MFEVNSSFIGNFKIGDNVNYNLNLLGILYRLQNEMPEHEKWALNKPITLMLISIIEVLLYDLHSRIRLFTVEGVENIATAAIKYIRRKGDRIDKFEKYITSAKRHNLLKVSYPIIYDELQILRQVRNRIHIQNEKRQLEENESGVFSRERKILAEKSLEKVVKIIAANYSRNLSGSYVSNFNFPWSEHFPSVNESTYLGYSEGDLRLLGFF